MHFWYFTQILKVLKKIKIRIANTKDCTIEQYLRLLNDNKAISRRNYKKNKSLTQLGNVCVLNFRTKFIPGYN